MKRNVLFVDDEPNVLMGLKRLLRPMRDAWDVYFAASGKEALEILQTVRMDAVVSDMRMPGMDGPELLTRVMQAYPNMIRFALSGYSDQEMVGRSIAPTHQYLTKPCEANRLINSLEQAMNARDIISNPEVLRKVASIKHLPVLPEAYNRITAELAKGDPSPRAIGDIVAHDLGLSANIMKLVNSAYFGLSGNINTPHQAVIVLGTEVLRSVILSLHVFQAFTSAGPRSFSLPLLWNHCLRTSAIARTIAMAEKMPKEVMEQSCTAALMHDVGKLLLDVYCPEECQRVQDVVRSANRRVADVEQELLGMTHAQVGGYLLGLWGLPKPVVRAVSQHHDTMPEPGPLGVVEIVYFANLLEHEIFIFNEKYAVSDPQPARLEAVGGRKTLDRWTEAVLAMELDEGEHA